MRFAISVTTLSFLALYSAAHRAVTNSNDRNHRTSRSRGKIITSKTIEILPISQQRYQKHNRRIQQDQLKNNSSPTDKNNGAVDDKTKAVDKSNVDKEKDATHFLNDLVPSDDCQLVTMSSNQLVIDCMNIASSSSPSSRDPKSKDKVISDKSKDKDSRIEYTVQTSSSGITVQVSQTNTIDMASSNEQQYEISYYQIIEYAKRDSSSISKAYDFDHDRILQTVELDTWDDFQSTALNNASTASASYYTAATTDGVAKFNFFVNKQEQDGPVPPTSPDITSNVLSIDFWLTSFPWRSGSDSYLALLSTVRSTGTSTQEQQQQQQQQPVVDYALVGGIDTMDNAVGNADTTNGADKSKSSKAKKNTDINVIFRTDDSSVTENTTSSSSSSIAVGTYQWPNVASTFFENGDNGNQNNDGTTVASLLGFGSSNSDTNATSTDGVDQTNNDSGSDIVSVIATSSSNRYDQELTIAYSFLGPDNTSIRTVYWEPQIGFMLKSSSDPIFDETSYNDVAGNPDDDFFGVYQSAASSMLSYHQLFMGVLYAIVTVTGFLIFG